MTTNTDILRGIGSNSATIGEAIDAIVGDTPVSVQLNDALSHMAEKNHTHDNYVSQEEFEALRRQVETLIDLVGDVSVAEQIMRAK